MKTTIESKHQGIWSKVRIGDALRLTNGRAFKPTEWVETGLPIVRIQNLNDPDAPFNRFDGDLPKKFMINNGDLLFAWSGTPGTSFGAHIWRGGKAWLNQHIFKVLFDDSVFDKRFLQLAINRNLNEYIQAAHGGAGLAHITKGRFEQSELLKPPLDEQRNIVAEIEKQFSRLDEAVAALKRIQANLKRYRAAVLKSAVEGQWPRTTVGKVATDVRYGTSAKTSEDARGVPVLRMGNIADGRLSLDKLKFLPASHPEFHDLLLKPGDMLFNRTNSAELVGKTAVYHGTPEPCSFASYLIRVRLDDNYLPDFLSYFINSTYGRKWIASVVSQQVGQANVNGSKLKDLSIPFPPIAEQCRIVAEVERRLSLADEVEAQVAANLHRASRLRQSILKMAFSGRFLKQEKESH